MLYVLSFSEQQGNSVIEFDKESLICSRILCYVPTKKVTWVNL